MPRSLDPVRLLLVGVAGWMNHQQQQVLDYLREENRVVSENSICLKTQRFPCSD